MQFVPFTVETASQLEALFAGNRPIPIRLWAILDGIIQGRILVNTPTKPALALVQELAEGTAYIGGAVTRQAVGEAFALLRQYQEVVICVWPDDPLGGELPVQPYYEGVAIDFTDRMWHRWR